MPDHSKWTYVKGPSDQNALMGTFCVVTFLGTWVTSLAVPILSVVCFGAGFYKAAIVMASAMVAAYVPWPKSKFLRLFYCKGFQGYFSESSLLYEEPVKQESNLICVHPHGIFCMGWGTLFTRPELDNFKFCFSPALFGSPFFRMLTKMTGSPQPADKSTFLRLMKEKKPLALIPGGFEEATLHHSSSHRVYCKKRVGYVKYALQHGYALTPTYCFGENQTYSNLQGGWGFRFWINGLGLPAIVPWGKWWCPLIPRAGRLHMVVGKPLQLPRIEKPSEEEVAKWHGQYMEALVGVFDRHKVSYGEPNAKLEVW